MIGRHKYEYLKSLKSLTDIQQKQKQEYETDKGLSPEQTKEVAQYFDKIGKPKKIKKVVDADVKLLIKPFYKYYFKNENIVFNPKANNGEALKLLYTILTYLFGHYKFMDSPLLTDVSKPNIRKGLFIVGGFGIGKTSILRALNDLIIDYYQTDEKIKDEQGNQTTIKPYKPLFHFHTALGIVEEYESLENSQKEFFWKRFTSGTRYFDDVMTERDASNYGKTNLFKELFEKRDQTKAKTIITLNYQGTFEETIEAFGLRYGGRNHSRLFKNYNFIKLQGKDLRKEL